MAFRYVVKEGVGWADNCIPKFPESGEHGQFSVSTANEVLDTLKKIISEKIQGKKIGMLMSGGIDSAIIAALLPQDTKTYTISFIAQGAINEAEAAKVYVDKLGMTHSEVEVTWDDYLESMGLLMLHKKAPLHPVEVGLCKAARAARADGIDILFVGNGADSTFGGMDELLAKDWTFDEFVKRYTFCEPARVLKNPVSVVDEYQKYRTESGINVQKFLKVTHGLGIIQMFDNAIEITKCSTIAPYEDLILGIPLDLARIRSGDTKYILRDVFKKLYPDFSIPEKIPFARPMEEWMKSYPGPKRPEFIDNLNMNNFSSEQKWQIFCLEKFLNLIEEQG